GGQALDEAVLDAHCHVLDDGLHGVGSSYLLFQGDAAHMLELARHCGIWLTAFMSWSGIVGMDVEQGNELIAKVVQAAPQEALGLSSADPTHQSAEEIKALCEKYHLGLGFRGMKPYFARNGIHYHDPLYNPYWEFGNQHGLYALLHTDETEVALNGILDLAKRFPAMTFLIAHSGGSWHYAKKVAELGRKCPAVFAELTLTPVLNGVIEYLCENLGADRVLFGTDAPMRDPRPQLAWVVNTRLPVETKRKILGGNFARVLLKSNLPGHALPSIVARAAAC
ncbi:MAG: amidohydrolase family protein, partial [Lentisphaerae bacterium]|nr:amidohydrolase family protein [Lentisphaerota bacterium]